MDRQNLLRKLAFGAVVVSLPVIFAVGAVQAAKVITPNDPGAASNSSIKFKPNPQTLAINELQDVVVRLEERIAAAEKKINAMEARNQELFETTQLQGATIITLREQVSIHDNKVNNIISCGANGETFTGRRCTSGN